MWEKFKNWVRGHKAAAGIIAGLVLVFIYWLYKKRSGGSEVEAAGMIYQPPASGGSSGGGGSGGDSSGDLAGLMSLIESQNQGNLDAISDMNSDMLEAMLNNQNSFLNGLAGMLNNIVQTPSAMTPNVPAVSAETAAAVNPLSGAKIWEAPVTRLFGGYGGGMVYAENPAQLEEFYNGGSRNMGGSYIIDATDWFPGAPGQPGSAEYANSKVSAITGGSGTIESQLSGMSADQKLSTLKQAGLI